MKVHAAGLEYEKSETVVTIYIRYLVRNAIDSVPHWLFTVCRVMYTTSNYTTAIAGRATIDLCM